jgi:hypothetical protein
MDFHIVNSSGDNILCCAASVASAFRQHEEQARVAKHCLPIGLEIGQLWRSGQHKTFEETAG